MTDVPPYVLDVKGSIFYLSARSAELLHLPIHNFGEHGLCSPNHVRPKLCQHSVCNTALANTVFNTVIQQSK